MASSKKSAASRSKHSKGRPISTSAISQPVSEDLLPVFSSFSANGLLFALVALAVDKHRLRVYNAISGRAVAEYTVPSARITALEWCSSPNSLGISFRDGSSPTQRKKKRTTSTGRDDEEQIPQLSQLSDVVALGLSNGTVQFFSPSHATVLHSTSHTTSSVPILSVAFAKRDVCLMWTSSADNTIRVWDVSKSKVLWSWKSQDRTPYSSISLRPSDDDSPTEFLVAHHHIKLLLHENNHGISMEPEEIASFTGHASSIRSLTWAGSSKQFFSMAENDRFIYVWDAEDGLLSNRKPAAAIALDSHVRKLTLATENVPQKNLVILSTTGKLTVVPIPDHLFSTLHGKGAHTLLPRVTISSVGNSRSITPAVVDLVPVVGDAGSVRIVRLIKGIKPVFDVIRYMDEDGKFLPSIVLEEVHEAVSEDDFQVALNKRYVESTMLAVASGISLDHADKNSIDQSGMDGSLQVDLAELSLGQRLTVVNARGDTSGSEGEEDGLYVSPSARKRKSTKNTAPSDASVIPANSLTRTLIQALHSSDTRLLEMCLAHTDSLLVQNTVRKLPPQLTIPLITACVERLGRGARAADMKGGSGGSSSQRGIGLIIWVKTVLSIHAGYLLTIPDLVARLSGLHFTLTTRLGLHESLLSLNGRLDMVLSQIEMRSSKSPASLPHQGEKERVRAKEVMVPFYVEGESEGSDDEDERIEGDIEAEDPQDEGSVEDIELGGDSESEEGDEEFTSSEEGEADGFIDDEAEEDSEDE